MNFTLRIGIPALLAVLSIPGTLRAREAGVRELIDYDLAGPFSLDRSSRHAEDRPIIEAAIREFLWTRWRQRRLAHLVTVYYSIEGLPSRSWYYVEPGKDGVWRIAIDDDITIPALKRGSQEHQREVRSYEALSVERVELASVSPAKPDRRIPDDQTREPETYRLNLKDRDGKIIREL
jgi:hypothetical protein